MRKEFLKRTCYFDLLRAGCVSDMRKPKNGVMILFLIIKATKKKKKGLEVRIKKISLDAPSTP